MRQLLSLLLLFSALPVHAQRITGTVTDQAGHSVEYVNIGVENSQTGLISDGNGRFSLTVPDSLAGGNLYVSHITYETQSIPIRELLARAADGQPLTIRLTERAFAVPEIVVRGGRNRYRWVGASTRPIPTQAYWFWPADILDTETGYAPSQYMSEVGTELTIKNSMLIEKVRFTISWAPDSMLVRVNLYSVESDSVFTPLHTRPFYAMIEPDSKAMEYEVDMSEGYVVAPRGKIVATVEQIKVYGGMTRMGVPAYVGPGYVRTRFHYRFRKGNAHIGLLVYGRLLRE